MHQDIMSVILALRAVKERQVHEALTAKQLLLLDMVKASLKKSPMPKGNRRIMTLPVSSRMNQLFQRILAGNFSKKDAQTFLSQLFYNDQLYQTLEPLLETAALSVNFPDTLPEDFWVSADDALVKLALSIGRIEKPGRGYFLFVQNTLKSLYEKIRPARFVPALAATILLAIVTLAVINRPNAVYLSYFQQTETPPLSKHSHSSVLRSAPSDAADRLSNLKNQLGKGLSSYLAGDYQSALERFKALEPAAETAEGSVEFLQWQQDYYFYYGMAHLGMSKGRPFSRSHAGRAAQFLSASIAAGESPTNVPDEARFFLGLSLLLQGDKQSAFEQLEQLSTSSEFYSSAIKLIEN